MPIHRSSATHIEQIWETLAFTSQDLVKMLRVRVALVELDTLQSIWYGDSLGSEDKINCAECFSPFFESGVCTGNRRDSVGISLYWQVLTFGGSTHRVGVIVQCPRGLPEESIQLAFSVLNRAATSDARISELREHWLRNKDHLSNANELVEKFWQLARADGLETQPIVKLMAEGLLTSIVRETGFACGAVYLRHGGEHDNAVFLYSSQFRDDTPGLDKVQEILSDVYDSADMTWELLEKISAMTNLRRAVPEIRSVFLAPLSPPAMGPIGAIALFSSRETGYDTPTDLDVETARVIGTIGAGMIAATLYYNERELSLAKDTLLDQVSHELYTPIYGLKTDSEMLMDPHYGLLDELQASIVDRMYEASRSALGMVDTILMSARLNAGRLPFEPTWLNASELATSVFGELALAAQSKRTAISIADSFNNVRLWADESQALTVLRNLLSNAIKFVGEDGRICVTGIESADDTRISVEDNGIGIDPDEQKRIFEKFYRIRSRDLPSVPGTGIGLSLVAELMTQHSGSVTVASKPGLGSTFTVIFPHPHSESLDT